MCETYWIWLTTAAAQWQHESDKGALIEYFKGKPVELLPLAVKDDYQHIYIYCLNGQMLQQMKSKGTLPASKHRCKLEGQREGADFGQGRFRKWKNECIRRVTQICAKIQCVVPTGHLYVTLHNILWDSTVEGFDNSLLGTFKTEATEAEIVWLLVQSVDRVPVISDPIMTSIVTFCFKCIISLLKQR